MDERELLESTPYYERLRKEYEDALNTSKLAREQIATKLTPDEMYESIQRALSSSPIRESEYRSSSSRALPRAARPSDPSFHDTIEIIPVDKDRMLEIRLDPRTGAYQFAATKTKTEIPKGYHSFSSYLDVPPPIPEKIKQDIASLNLSKHGYVQMVNSSAAGAKEGAINRLMMEATKRGITPYSSNLLEPGKKMVQKFKTEFETTPKEKYIQKLSDFLSTGKTGKIWSQAAPILKGAGAGLGIAGALTAPDVAQAAADIVIPGGVESMGVSEEQKELDKKYTQKLREMSKGKK